MINTGYFWGMHLIWWFVWALLLVWVFAIPYDIPGQRKRRDSALDILRGRFAAGLITTQEYNEKKLILENDLTKANRLR